MLRVAIAGAGFVGRVHVLAARAAGAAVVGIAASTPERGAQAARELGVPRAYDTAEELAAAPDVDVVHVCTPNDSHEPLTLRALEAGKHVICEKPLALDLAGAERLAAAAASSPVMTAVPFAYRYYPTVREARARVASGETGRISLVHGTYLQDWLLTPGEGNWRAEPARGGASRTFADIGSHWCDLAEFVTGDRIARLSARTLAGDGAENGAVVQFETAGGALGSTVVSQVSPGRKNRLWLEVDGTAASVAFSQERPDTLRVGTPAQTTIVERDPQTLSPGAARLARVPAGHPQGYQDCFDLFVADVYAAIAGAEPDGLPTFADGLRAARITDAVLRSAADRAWVEL